MVADGAVDSRPTAALQMPPSVQGRFACSRKTIASCPSGVRKNRYAFSSPSLSNRCTLFTDAPVADADGVSAPNAATGALNATTTCGWSPGPWCCADA